MDLHAHGTTLKILKPLYANANKLHAQPTKTIIPNPSPQVLEHRFPSTMNRLYHYTSANVAFSHILESGLMRLSPLDRLNDPRESLDWMFSLSADADRDIDTEEFLHIIKEINKKLKNDVKIVCFTKSAAPPPNTWAQEIFYEGFARARMWAQYAENHAGVCLAFDSNRISSAFQGAFSSRRRLVQGPVFYTNNFLHRDNKDIFHISDRQYLDLGIDQLLDHKFDQLHDLYFFTKNEDWSAEHEYRMLIKEEDAGYQYFSFADSLEAIILGHAFPGDLLETAKSFGNSRGVPVMKMHWRNGYPSLLPLV